MARRYYTGRLRWFRNRSGPNPRDVTGVSSRLGMDTTVSYDTDDPPQPHGRPVSTEAFPDAIGSYAVLGELGRGGMGVVLLARDNRLEREVAIKLLPHGLDDDPESRDRFLAEARMLAALNHPNIAIIHSLEESAGRHFLTMEPIAGRS